MFSWTTLKQGTLQKDLLKTQVVAREIIFQCLHRQALNYLVRLPHYPLGFVITKAAIPLIIDLLPVTAFVFLQSFYLILLDSQRGLFVHHSTLCKSWSVELLHSWISSIWYIILRILHFQNQSLYLQHWLMLSCMCKWEVFQWVQSRKELEAQSLCLDSIKEWM